MSTHTTHNTHYTQSTPHTTAADSASTHTHTHTHHLQRISPCIRNNCWPPLQHWGSWYRQEERGGQWWWLWWWWCWCCSSSSTLARGVDPHTDLQQSVSQSQPTTSVWFHSTPSVACVLSVLRQRACCTACTGFSWSQPLQTDCEISDPITSHQLLQPASLQRASPLGLTDSRLVSTHHPAYLQQNTLSNLHVSLTLASTACCGDEWSNGLPLSLSSFPLG